MAKILPGLAVSKMSGTVAGTTYQNWRGILVARSKPTPTNVNTPRQSVVRALMTLLSRAWRDELNQGLRTAWNQRAKSFPWLDVFGNSVSMTGENLYIKQNMVLLDHSLARQDTPVSEVMPRELTDIVDTSEGEPELSLVIPGSAAGEITAQAPFIDIWIAGGFLAIQEAALPNDLPISTLALPSGRKQQKSDFRHAFYLTAPDIVTTPETTLRVSPPSGHTRNVAVVVRRYNKYGNFSAPRIFNHVLTAE